MRHRFIIISNALAVLAFTMGGAVAAVPQDHPGNGTATQMPQGLWEAFSKARLLIEPVKDPTSGARFAGQNPANRIRFLFGENGVTFKPGRSGHEWTLGMQLEAYGDAAYLTRNLHLDGNTVTLDRGVVQEWYINRPEGLEQGFTLAGAPQGHAPGQEISLTLQLSGDLEAVWRSEGESLAFYTAQNDYTFSYDKLVVVDAAGKNLPAKMVLEQDRLQLRFDPAGARWPVTVDPLVSIETKLVGADDDAAADDLFALSVALEGDTALIGADRDDCTAGTDCGAAYVFARTGSSWGLQGKLIAGDAQHFDLFGYSVALSGDTALIGAFVDDCTAGADCGAAYLYHFPCAYGSGLLADRWTMIGLPCLPSASTVEDIFGGFLNPARYNSRWVVYERNEIADAYSMLDLASPMALGVGYWIISLDATVWDVDGVETLKDTTNPNCPTIDGCYVIDLTPPAAAGDPPRFNLIGHVFSFDVDWEDVRVEVAGTGYTPGAAETAGYMEKEMWIYNGNGYDVFDDSTPGMEGTLVPQDGIWVAVLNGAAGETVKLLVPVMNTFGSPPPPPTLP